MLISIEIPVLIAIFVCTGASAQNRNSNSDLVNAVESGNDASVRQIIENGANPNILDSKRKTLMHLASEKGFDKVVQTLIEKGYTYQVHSKDADGNIPLHLAAAFGHDKVVNLLIQYGSDVNLKNSKDGSVPLHPATWNGHGNIMELLIRSGGNVNAKNSFGDTALHLLALRGHDKIAHILLDNGADIHSRSSTGKVARDYALARGNQKLVNLLDSAALNQNQPKFHPTPTKSKNIGVELAALTQAQPDFRPIPAKSKSAGVIEIACQKYASKKPSDFIVGPADEAKPEEFPWMVALGYFNERTNSIDYRCGGTIISENFVLTAAHCIPEERPVIVRTGRININDRDANNYYIQEIIWHQNFTDRFQKHDIALIRLTKNIQFTRDIRPACLETDPSDLSPNVELDITGWGTKSVESGETSDVLLKAKVTTVPLSECNRVFTEYNRRANLAAFRTGITEGQYCGHNLSGSDACKGDSGGPLQVFRHKYTAHVVGIVSFGISCGLAFPGIYTRVAHYSDWIASYVWPNGS